MLNNVQTKASLFCVSLDELLPRVALYVTGHASLLFYQLANSIQLFRELPARVRPSQVAWQGDAITLVHTSGAIVIDAIDGSACASDCEASQLSVLVREIA